MGNILQQLYNTVDAFILGRFAGDLEFAAVGVAGSVMNLFLFMITGACTGISVIFAQLYGAGERERFRREHWLSLSCGLLVTLACSGLGFLLLSPLLRLIQTPSELKTFVSVYLTIILASLPAAFLYNLYGALLRAIGRANAALMVLAAAVTVNVALDYCFVARSQLGIAGAAWATAASQAISAVLCILYLRRKAPELIFARADCRMDGELLKRTAHFSFVTALHQSSLYIGKLLVQGAVNTGGDANRGLCQLIWRQRQRCDLRARGTESGSRERRAREGIVSQQPFSDACDGGLRCRSSCTLARARRSALCSGRAAARRLRMRATI